MHSGQIVAVEEAILDAEIRRRVRRRVPRVARDPGNIHDLAELPLLVGGASVVSFDFFDTLVHRTRLCLEAVQRKTAIFGAELVDVADRSAVQQTLYGCRGFGAARMKARMVRDGLGDEPLLDDLFAAALASFVSDPEHARSIARRMVDYETKVEIENLRPAPGAAEVLKALRAMGRRVVVTSDMYLPGDAVRALVEANGFGGLTDAVRVSSEAKATKAGGGLYDILCREMDAAPEEVLHVGDSFRGDVVAARARGVRAVHYFNRDAEIARAALTMRHDYEPNRKLRRVRVRERFGLSHGAPLRSAEALIDQVIGPAFALATLRAMRHAARTGADRVWFLTRDGTLFAEIAERLEARIPVLGRPGPYPTLASSRATFTVLEFTRLDHPPWLVHHTRHNSGGRFSLARMCTVFGLELADFDGLPAPARGAIARRFEEEGEGALHELLDRFPGFRGRLERALLDRRALLEAYLEQEGLLVAKRAALVDIGYSATAGKSLSHLLARREAEGLPVPRVDFLFMCTNRFLHQNLRAFHPAVQAPPGFLLSHERRGVAPLALNNAWLEPFALDKRLGKLTGYARDAEGFVQPVFAEPHVPAEEIARNAELRARIVARADRFAADLLAEDADEEEVMAEILDRLARFVIHPRRAEVAALRELRHQVGMSDVQARALTRRVRPWRLTSEVAALRREDYWVQGSFARSGLGALNRFWRADPDRDPPRRLRKLR